MNGSQYELLSGNELEFEDEEFESDFENDFESDFESDFEADLEGGFGDGEGETPFSEEEELELAAELLEVRSDEELEQFLGKLFRRIGRGARRFARSRLGRRLGGILKGAARRTLVSAGRSLGGRLGPGGAAAGGRLAALAGRRFFGLELEGLSPEDQEFEVARRFVRFAGQATRNAARSAGRGPSSKVAQQAATAAARRFAPGLVRGGSRRHGGGSGRRSGRWVRRGRRIIVMGV